MIAKDTIRVQMTKPFSLRERLRVLFGFQLMQIGFVEINAKGDIRRKEITLTHEMKGVQAFWGKPEKKPALPMPEGPSL